MSESNHSTPVRFIQARHFTPITPMDPLRAREVDLVVLHSMESAERPRVAQDVALWFAGQAAPRASAHFCVDHQAVVQSVRLGAIAWHAPGANHNGVGIEHAGRAGQSAADWQDIYSLATLRLSAKVAAFVCRRYTIPVLFIGVRELLQGKRGITTHAAVSEAFRKSTHTDPGPGFPMPMYLDLVAEALAKPDELGLIE